MDRLDPEQVRILMLQGDLVLERGFFLAGGLLTPVGNWSTGDRACMPGSSPMLDPNELVLDRRDRWPSRSAATASCAAFGWGLTGAALGSRQDPTGLPRTAPLAKDAVGGLARVRPRTYLAFYVTSIASRCLRAGTALNNNGGMKNSYFLTDSFIVTEQLDLWCAENGRRWHRKDAGTRFERQLRRARRHFWRPAMLAAGCAVGIHGPPIPAIAARSSCSWKGL